MGRGDCVFAATAKIETRRGPLAVSQQVNGACSCSEGRRQTTREAATGCKESEERGDTSSIAEFAGLWRCAGPRELRRAHAHASKH